MANSGFLTGQLSRHCILINSNNSSVIYRLSPTAKGTESIFVTNRGELISVEHSDGYVLEIDSRGRTIHAVELVTQEKRQKLLQSTFSERGYLVQCQSFQYGTLSHEYDPKGYMVRWRDTDSTDVAVRYDISGRVVALKHRPVFLPTILFIMTKNAIRSIAMGKGEKPVITIMKTIC